MPTRRGSHPPDSGVPASHLPQGLNVANGRADSRPPWSVTEENARVSSSSSARTASHSRMCHFEDEPVRRAATRLMTRQRMQAARVRSNKKPRLRGASSVRGRYDGFRILAERNGRRSDPSPPWTVGRGKQRLVYFEEEPGRASGAAWCSGGLDPSTECVGVVLSSNARAKTQARLMRKARVRADSTRVRSTNETSLCIAIKKEKPLPCSGSQSPIA
jgi:hypothetical protein